MLAYLAIVSTSVAALAGAPWWAAVACGCLLTLMSIAEQQGRTTSSRVAAGGHLVGGMTAGAAAFLLGRASGWLWGI